LNSGGCRKSYITRGKKRGGTQSIERKRGKKLSSTAETETLQVTIAENLNKKNSRGVRRGEQVHPTK